jgi:hypothetical protein
MITANIRDASLGYTPVTAMCLGNSVLWQAPKSAISEANNWLSAIYQARLANGGVGFLPPSSTVFNATKDFLTTLYLTGLRAKILRLNLFAGGDYLASFVPLIRDAGAPYWDYNGIYGSTASQLANGPFTAQMWSLLEGFNPYSVNNLITGTSSAGAYLDTGISASATSPFLASLSNYSVHFACCVSTIGNKDANTEIGINGRGSYVALRANWLNYTSTQAMPGFYTYSGSTTSYSTPNALIWSPAPPFDPRGFIVGTRTSNNYTAFYRKGALPPGKAGYYNPNTTPVSYSPLEAVATVVIFAGGNNAPLGSPKVIAGGYTDRALTMYSIGAGLTDSEVALFTSAVATFNNAIGRSNF